MTHFRLFLPFLHRPPPPQPDHTGDFIALMRDDPAQRRPALLPHPTLMAVAQRKAEDMHRRDYFAHEDPQGYGANHLVRQAGYPLPAWYQDDAASNNVEALGAGYGDAAALWAGLIGSPGHRMFVLGAVPMWAEQTRIGVGWADGAEVGKAEGERRAYWCVITCPEAVTL